MKRWSKLRRDIESLMQKDFQIHCVAYRMPNSVSTNPQIPRYWITEGKEIVWDTAKMGKKVNLRLYDHIPTISNLIREYINTPRQEVRKKKFEEDVYGLTEVLKRNDRRFKKK